MIETGLIGLVAIPAGLGLIGFFEPCSLGASLIFLNYLEGKGATERIGETVLFTLTRGLFIGALGAAAALFGALFLDLQRGAWILLGSLYAALGLLLATGRARTLMVAAGPALRALGGKRGAAGLGILFGLNIPACAAPLILALLAGAAAGGASASEGFIALAVFGLALSLPLVGLVLVPRLRPLIDRAAALSGRYPLVAGLVLMGLGVWSIWFGLFVALEAQAS